MTDDRNERPRLQDLLHRLELSDRVRAAVEQYIAVEQIPTGTLSGVETDEAGSRDSSTDDLGTDALEAIVQRVGRPPLLIEHSEVVLEDLLEFPEGTDARIKAFEPWVASVGRVEFINYQRPWGGTAWVMQDDGDSRVVATTRHVVGAIARRGDYGGGAFLRDQSQIRYGAAIDFSDEVGPLSFNRFAVTEVVYLADDLAPDVALLRIVGENLPPAMDLAEHEAAEGLPVGLIGYPVYDPMHEEDLGRYFRDLYGVKRFAPGYVIQAIGGFTPLRHDCTSLQGNSGSPLIALETGHVVGMHFSGRYGQFNAAVGVMTLRKLLEGSRPIVAGFELAASKREPEDVVLGDGIHNSAHFAGRKGYDPAFLGNGLHAPWPGLHNAAEVALATPTDATEDRPHELRYAHFGVKYHLDRKMPLMTAANIDRAHGVQLKRFRDRWFKDLRVPAGSQFGLEDFHDVEITRSPMVRRHDVAWDSRGTDDGDLTELAAVASVDVHHCTNSLLQYPRLELAGQLWQGLEDHVVSSIHTDGFRACVFTGPILRDDDPEFWNGMFAPLELWKLVVMAAADGESKPRLHATAYVLSEGTLVRDLLEVRSKVEVMEGFTLGAYRTFQVAVADLADATGFDFNAYVEADPLAGGPAADAIAANDPVFVPLARLDQIVL